MTIPKLSQPLLTRLWLLCKPGGTLLVGVLVAMSALDWLGDRARDAYCQLDEYVDSVNDYLFGSGINDGLNGVQDFLGLGCEPVPPPVPTPPPPGNPGCSGGVTTFFDLTLTGSFNAAPAENNFGGYITGAPRLNDTNTGTVIDIVRNDGVASTFLLSNFGSDVNHIVNNVRVVPLPGTVCPPRPPGGDRPPNVPPRQSPPIRDTPPPPATQVPWNITFNFGNPFSIPAIIPVVIPVVANIRPEFNFAPTFNIPFTLNLPDLTANFDFAFNPDFNLFNIEGVPINFPPEGVPPGEVLDGCEESEPVPPLFKIEDRIVGAYVYFPVDLPVRGLTRVLRGISGFNESIYPRFGHIQFVLSDIANTRVASMPVTERYGYVPCPDPYGASAVQFNPMPGMEGASIFAIRRPVAIPVKEDGAISVAFEPVTVI